MVSNQLEAEFVGTGVDFELDSRWAGSNWVSKTVMIEVILAASLSGHTAYRQVSDRPVNSLEMLYLDLHINWHVQETQYKRHTSIGWPSRTDADYSPGKTLMYVFTTFKINV